MKCQMFEQQYLDELDGLLEASEAEALRAHREGCEACQALYEEARAGLHVVRRFMVVHEPPAALDQRIMAAAQEAITRRSVSQQLSDETQQRGFFGWLSTLLASPSFQPALAFCAVAMLVGSVYVYQSRQGFIQNRKTTNTPSLKDTPLSSTGRSPKKRRNAPLQLSAPMGTARQDSKGKGKDKATRAPVMPVARRAAPIRWKRKLKKRRKVVPTRRARRARRRYRRRGRRGRRSRRAKLSRGGYLYHRRPVPRRRYAPRPKTRGEIENLRGRAGIKRDASRSKPGALGGVANDTAPGVKQFKPQPKAAGNKTQALPPKRIAAPVRRELLKPAKKPARVPFATPPPVGRAPRRLQPAARTAPSMPPSAAPAAPTPVAPAPRKRRRGAPIALDAARTRKMLTKRPFAAGASAPARVRNSKSSFAKLHQDLSKRAAKAAGRGNNPSAINLYNQSLRYGNNRQKANAYMQLGILYLRQNNTAAAKRHFDMAIRYTPAKQRARLYRRITQLYKSRGKYKNAVKMLRRMMRLYPNQRRRIKDELRRLPNIP